MTTTIKLSERTKTELDNENRDKETYNDTVQRLLDMDRGKIATKAETREIAREIVRQEVVPEALE